jgi:hypothetical protein
MVPSFNCAKSDTAATSVAGVPDHARFSSKIMVKMIRCGLISSGKALIKHSKEEILSVILRIPAA